MAKVPESCHPGLWLVNREVLRRAVKGNSAALRQSNSGHITNALAGA